LQQQAYLNNITLDAKYAEYSRAVINQDAACLPSWANFYNFGATKAVPGGYGLMHYSGPFCSGNGELARTTLWIVAWILIFILLCFFLHTMGIRRHGQKFNPSGKPGSSRWEEYWLLRGSFAKFCYNYDAYWQAKAARWHARLAKARRQQAEDAKKLSNLLPPGMGQFSSIVDTVQDTLTAGISAASPSHPYAHASSKSTKHNASVNEHSDNQAESSDESADETAALGQNMRLSLVRTTGRLLPMRTIRPGIASISIRPITATTALLSTHNAYAGVGSPLHATPTERRLRRNDL
jgi:hypothetical protein